MQPVFRYTLMITTLSILAVWLVGCGALVTSPSPPIKATGSTAIAHSYPTPDVTQVLYKNALTRQATGWAYGPACVSTPNGLSVRPDGGQAYICLAPTVNVADLSISVTARQTSGASSHAFGIAFHHDAPKNYYFFGINAHGRFTLTIVVNEVSHTVIPFTRSMALRTGIDATNQLQVIEKGQVVTVLVNGTPVGQATLSTFASGTVGLRGINDGEVLFQHLSISQL